MAHDGHRINVQVHLVGSEAPSAAVLLPHPGEVVGGKVADALGNEAEARGRTLLVGMKELAVVVCAFPAESVHLKVLNHCAVLEAEVLKYARLSIPFAVALFAQLFITTIIMRYILRGRHWLHLLVPWIPND